MSEVEIDKAMLFVTSKLEKDCTPISIEYSLASFAASMKRIADRMDGSNGGVHVSNSSISFYQLEQVLSQIRDRLSNASGVSQYSPNSFTDYKLQEIANSLQSLANARQV